MFFVQSVCSYKKGDINEQSAMAKRLKNRTIEYIIYTLFWSVIFFSPVWGSYLNGSIDILTWDEVFNFWGYLAPALVLFFVNNNVLIPFLLYKKKGGYYILYALCVIVICSVVYIIHPAENKAPKHPPRLYLEAVDIGSPLSPGSPHVYGADVRPKGAGMNIPQVYVHPADSGELSTILYAYRPLKRPPRADIRFLIANPKNLQILMVVFVLVFNICVRLSFFSIRHDERLKELEKEKLRSELEYLKYQINPHFFMNTLNNIHALIDIDSDKAQAAVQELSKMMRYVLYDASSTFVPLEKEITFLQSYIDLMRLRYTDKLEILASFPIVPQGLYAPSLLFMQFVENAFKHGVTYKKKSCIAVEMTLEDNEESLCFRCANSVVPGNSSSSNEQGGIGVENARKRLSLLYGESAQMQITNDGEWYKVELKIPIRNA